MNDQKPVNTTALSELDRLGQQVLDAIWQEEAMYNGNKDAVNRLIGETRNMDPAENLRQMGELLGCVSTEETIHRAMHIFQKGVEREQAVKQYLMARRLLDSVL